MTAYNVSFSFNVEEYGQQVFNADDVEQAESFAIEWVRETYPESNSVSIEEIKEVN